MSYFTTLLESISNNTKNDLSALVQSDKESSAKINYIIVFDPSVVSDSEELEAELSKQVLCFALEKTYPTSSSKVNIVGLVRGILSLAASFSSHETLTNAIHGSKSTTIVKTIGMSQYLICSVSTPKGSKNHTIVNQLITIIDQFVSFYALLHGGTSQDAQTFWQNFLDAYNTEFFAFPSDLDWPNTLNYSGFNSIWKQGVKTSSVLLSFAAKDEIDEYVEKFDIAAISIANFDTTSPKRSGLIYSANYTDVDSESLATLYKWLEYHDYHHTLSAKKLDEFASAEPIKTSLSRTEPDDIDMLSPLALTSLVTAPFTYTMTGMMSMGEILLNRTEPTEPSEPAPSDSISSWIPNLNPFAAAPPEPEGEPEGEFIVGPVKNEVYTKTVFLPQEHSLVVFRKDTLVIALACKTIPLYDELQQKTLEPIIEAIVNFILGGSIVGSIGSFPAIMQTEEDFFFTIFNEKDKTIQSSLPDLPVPSSSKLVLSYQNAIFHLHHQLIDIFVNKADTTGNINEYLHKFNSNKLNDWMFYYIKYQQKQLVIIKNKHHTKKPEKEGIIRNIAGNVYDYAHLGFFDSLGDDVKLWIESLTSESQQ